LQNYGAINFVQFFGPPCICSTVFNHYFQPTVLQ